LALIAVYIKSQNYNKMKQEQRSTEKLNRKYTIQ
jgi:hypothetical protein